MSSFNGASKVKILIKCHGTSQVIKWCLMENKPHHLNQTLAHDIIIKEPNIKVREPLSKVE
jgi:hypothetical protein